MLEEKLGRSYIEANEALA